MMSSNLNLIFKFCSLLVLAFSFSSKIYGLSEIFGRPVNSTNDTTTEEQNTKYILQWTSSYNDLSLLMGTGRQGFIDRNCFHTNCFVTNEREILDNYTKFDAILFYGPEVWAYSKYMLPQDRLEHQKYVFVSDKCSDFFPVLSEHFDGFFNWTWTYRLDSDLIWRRIVVTDQNNTIIGPNLNMHWIKRDNMAPVPRNLIKILEKKSEAVFWMPFDCNIAGDYRVKKLQTVLKKYYELNLDIYGECSELKCISGDTYDEDDDECSSMILNDYYFYIVYEEAKSVDYVTTDILPALQNHAVPIVFGGANYSRFLPEGSYLNAEELDIDSLASKIRDLIDDNNKYIEYFKWTNHYQYHSYKEYRDSNQYCKLCSLLNDKKFNQTSEYHDFRTWWNVDQLKEFKVRTGKTLPVIYSEPYTTETILVTRKNITHKDKETIIEKIINFAKIVIEKISDFLLYKY